MSMWLGTSRPTGGLNSTSPYGRRIKIRTSETVLRAQTTQLRVYSDTPLRYAPGFRHIQTISIISIYQYPRGGTYDDAHHVLGETIQQGIVD
ncbi:hypothetical protein Pyn_08221 [Prunus yedoensis var. nudiflora]|uniref:Uncharacterized protein n=1 Tax=Prunus yedoensis var. nudiflora TaxID=2094558 RepID=A0A314UGC6_PRUYE|nr:hypothetical protein Pyn_08221 [Prunus yedoensis var. nudiflora]